MCTLCTNFYQLKRVWKHTELKAIIFRNQKSYDPNVSRTRADFRAFLWVKEDKKSIDWAISDLCLLCCTFVDVFKTKECTYVCMYYIKKRLFIQKPICEVYLQLKLCLMNCFIKKLTRYQFDWGKASLYISLYVLTIWSLAHLLGWANKDLRLI